MDIQRPISISAYAELSHLRVFGIEGPYFRGSLCLGLLMACHNSGGAGGSWFLLGREWQQLAGLPPQVDWGVSSSKSCGKYPQSYPWQPAALPTTPSLWAIARKNAITEAASIKQIYKWHGSNQRLDLLDRITSMRVLNSTQPASYHFNYRNLWGE